MISIKICNRLLTIELRNGVGLDLEFVDSKPVWTYNHLTEEHSTMPFEGAVILIPFMSITYGRPYKEIESE